MARILIFEDDTDFADLLRQSLEADGHSVGVTADGDEAFRRLAASEFDLALVDIFIRRDRQIVPNGGLLLLGRLRSLRDAPGEKPRPKVPVIAISGEFSNTGIGEIGNFAKSFGAEEVLAKPFTQEELAAAMNRLLPSA